MTELEQKIHKLISEFSRGLTSELNKKANLDYVKKIVNKNVESHLSPSPDQKILLSRKQMD